MRPSSSLWIIVHSDRAQLGWLPQWAQRHWNSLRLVYAMTDALPDPEALSGPVIVMGGRMGVAQCDELAWLAAERDWIARLLALDHPMLGVCLGAQLIASCLGGRVTSCPQRTAECGYYPTNTPDLPPWVYHWHQDGIAFPDPVERLQCLGVSGWRQGSTSQAFVRARAMGVQFHPEVDENLIRCWLDHNRSDLSWPGARPASTHLSDHTLHGPAVRAWMEYRLNHLWSLPGGCYHE